MKKNSIHRYLIHCETNPQPPGFADFLRGTITLYLLSKKYNYNFYIDYNSHPVFKNFKFDDTVYIKNTDCENKTIELLPPIDYKNIYNNLKKLFMENKNMYLLTNSFHSGFGISSNYTCDEVKDAHKFIQKMLIPSPNFQNVIDAKMKNMKIVENDYYVVHLRFNDCCLFDTSFDISEKSKNEIINLIDDIDKKKEKKIVILSNWKAITNFLQQKNSNVIITNGSPIHTGNLNNLITINNIINKSAENEEVTNQLSDTMFDLYIISRCSEIYCASQYGRSGFSYEVSTIYNIKYNNISHKIF
jgi:hypothetical protein